MTTLSEMTEQQTLQGLLKQGFQELNRGRVREAASYCQKALQIKPDLVPAHFLVGLVALEAKDRKTAFQAFGSVTKLQENHSAAWAQLAKLFITEGQINRGDHALSQALKHKSQDPMVLDLLGSVFSSFDEHKKAQNCYKEANSLRPNHPPYMINYANNLIYHGEFKKSEDILNQLIKIDPNNPQAHWSISGSVKASDTKHIKAMGKILDNHKIHPRALAFLHYSMGKEYEDLEIWAEAFEAFSKGAQARRKTVEYDEQNEIDYFNFLEKNYTREWFNNLPEGNFDASPIFVLGQPRTGTTLIERIITSHSQVHSAGELQQFGLGVRRLTNYQNPKRFSLELFKSALTIAPEKLGSHYIFSTQKLTNNAARFVDKLPHNYLMIPLILKALPNAKIVHLTRNPMDSCFASFKQLFADAYLHSYDQAEMARHHARYRHLMAVWRERFDNRFFDICYEATASDLEPNARALLAYLDLPWEDACLNFHEQVATVSTASSVQVREPVHTRSIGRWKRYENQLVTMINTLKEHGLSID